MEKGEENGSAKDRLQLECRWNQSDVPMQYWPIFEAAWDQMMVCCGLRSFDLLEKACEFESHLRKRFWGSGYAAEAAIESAFFELGAERITAGRRPRIKIREKFC